MKNLKIYKEERPFVLVPNIIIDNHEAEAIGIYVKMCRKMDENNTVYISTEVIENEFNISCDRFSDIVKELIESKAILFTDRNNSNACYKMLDDEKEEK